MNRGYISIWRRIKDWKYYQDSESFHLWVHILLSANHKDNYVNCILVKRGQLLTSIDSLSRETKVNRSKVRRILKKLKNDNQIGEQITNKYRIISITNYDLYSSSDMQKGKQAANKRQTNDKQMAPNNNDNNVNNYNNYNKLIVEKTKKVKNEKSDGTQVWFSYANAYESRYKTQPTRNAKTNSLCKRLVEYAGKDDAIKLAAHYLSINDQWYLKNYHKLDFLLSDYQKIITSMKSGININSTRAQQIDKLQSNHDAFANVARMYEKGGKNG